MAIIQSLPLGGSGSTYTNMTTDEAIAGTNTEERVVSAKVLNDAIDNKIPTVNNATLTIQKNGTTVKTFTANASANVTANITVPTKVSDLTNDSGFLTTHQDISGKADKSTTLSGYGITDAYTKTQVDNKIPTVNNATLTIQKNGTTVKTFTANASSNVTCNITVPTKISDLTNDGGFVSDLSSYYSKSETDTLLSGKSNTDHTHSNYLTGITKSMVTTALGYTPPTTNTTYNVATTSANGLMSSTDKTKLDGLSNYTLPTASSELGGVKTTSTVTSTSGLTACPIISGVPYYKDTNTTYSSMSAAEATTGTATNARSISAKVLNDKIDEKVSAISSTYITKDDGIVGLSVNGKVITYTKGDGSTGTITTQDTNTWTAFKGATSSANGTAGYVPAPTKGNQDKFFKADGTWAVPTNTTYSFSNSAPTLAWGTTSTIGTVGGVDLTVTMPANPNTDTHWTTTLYAGAKDAKSNAVTTNGNSYIKLYDNNTVRSQLNIKGSGATTVTTDANGVITINSTDNNTTYSVATTSKNGLMSSTDKTKLDGLSNYTLPTASSTLGGVKTTSTVTSTSGLTACPIISGVPYYKDTNTTYSAMSAAEATTGTATTARSITAKVLHDKISAMLPTTLESLSTNTIPFHNAYPRCKYLGTSITDAQNTAIKNRTYDDLFIGDYWTINGVNWRIVAVDYYYNIGDVNFDKGNIIVMPDTVLYYAQMNETNTTAGGYVGSLMRTQNLNNAITIAQNAFGSHLANHRVLLANNVDASGPSSWAWYDSDGVELPNEVQIYGTRVWGSALKGRDVATQKYQFPLLAFAPQFMNTRQTYWLQDVSSASVSSYFAFVHLYGYADDYVASNSLGVRPSVTLSYI